MRPVIRYRSQLLYRRAYRPNRPVQTRHTQMRVVARPARTCKIYRRSGADRLTFLVSF
jgi:hypothetical protein